MLCYLYRGVASLYLKNKQPKTISYIVMLQNKLYILVHICHGWFVSDINLIPCLLFYIHVYTATAKKTLLICSFKERSCLHACKLWFNVLLHYGYNLYVLFNINVQHNNEFYYNSSRTNKQIRNIILIINKNRIKNTVNVYFFVFSIRLLLFFVWIFICKN